MQRRRVQPDRSCCCREAGRRCGAFWREYGAHLKRRSFPALRPHNAETRSQSSSFTSNIPSAKSPLKVFTHGVLRACRARGAPGRRWAVECKGYPSLEAGSHGCLGVLLSSHPPSVRAGLHLQVYLYQSARHPVGCGSDMPRPRAHPLQTHRSSHRSLRCARLNPYRFSIHRYNGKTYLASAGSTTKFCQ